MKFQVRQGFVIHDQRIVEVNGKPTEQTHSYYEGQLLDCDEDTAAKHLHKLEPQDKAAREFAAARHVPVAASAGVGMDPAALAQLIAQAVAAAVAGLQVPAAPASSNGPGA